MGLIALRGLEFYAYHGVYPEEREKGNKFLVNVSLDYNFEEQALKDELENTINYEEIYSIVNSVMEEPAKLLEYLALTISNNIKERFPNSNQVKVEVRKYNPPIKGECDYASVEVTS